MVYTYGYTDTKSIRQIEAIQAIIKLHCLTGYIISVNINEHCQLQANLNCLSQERIVLYRLQRKVEHSQSTYHG